MQLDGVYSEHVTALLNDVIEIHDNTLLLSYMDGTLRLRNAISYARLGGVQLSTSSAYRMIRTQNKLRIVLGLQNGTVEMRRASDLELISSFELHSDIITCVCELDAGTFATASVHTIKRWNQDGTMLQTFMGHIDWVKRLIEVKPYILVSLESNYTLKVWNVYTGKCLHTIETKTESELIKLERGTFATSSWKGGITVWSDEGERLQTIKTDKEIEAMGQLRDGSVFTANSRGLLEIRKL